MSKTQYNFTLCRWNGSALSPYSQLDIDNLGGLISGKSYRVDVKNYRSVPRHRLFRAILRVVCENSEHFTDPDSLKDTLLVALGVVKPVLTIDDGYHFMPCSTAFDQLDEERFRGFMTRALDIIHNNILPGVDVGDLLAEARSRSGWGKEHAA